MDDCLVFAFGVVLLIPCLGLFICPFPVAGLGFKYFRINFLLMFGHPLSVGGDVDIVAGITKLGEQVVGNTKLE
jgi:hypothetical protein